MRKIIAGFAASIDGFIEGPNGEYDWIINDAEYFKEYSKQWKNIDTMLYGRKTYEVVIKHQATEKSNPFAHMKHYVFSHSLEKAAPGFVLKKNELKDDVMKIKNEPGKNIAVFGGAALLSSMINLKLVDELIIAISPVLLGKGKHSFINIENRNYFNLKTAKSYSSGLVVLTYETKLS
jgi:dihydrofolate reductase